MVRLPFKYNLYNTLVGDYPSDLQTQEDLLPSKGRRISPEREEISAVRQNHLAWNQAGDAAEQGNRKNGMPAGQISQRIRDRDLRNGKAVPRWERRTENP